MKWIFLLLSLLSISAMAQQWKPIVQGGHYNFQATFPDTLPNPHRSPGAFNFLPTEVLDFHYKTVWVDSFATFGTDSLLYFNHIPIGCDTCMSGSQGELYLHLNEPGIFGKKVTQQANGVFLFENPFTFVLHTQARQGASWTFDSVANIIATIDSVYSRLILGSIDSVKLITLSNGLGEILLSKNHGILAFPPLIFPHQMELIGIEGRGLGVKHLGLREIYDFSVGDVFQHELCRSFDGGAGGYCVVQKRTILSKSVQGDTLDYTYRSIDNYKIIDTTTIRYIDSIDHTMNAYHDEFVGIPLGANYGYPKPGVLGSYIGLDAKRYKISRGFFSEQGIPSFRIGNSFFFPTNDPFTVKSLNSIYGADGTAFFQEGLGELYSYLNQGEDEYIYWLMGYQRAGVTHGTLTPDSVFLANGLGIEDSYKKYLPIQPFPNPTNGILYLSFPQPINTPLTAQLYDFQGQIVLKKTIQPTAERIEWDLRTLSNGMYILLVQSNQGMFREKILLAK